MLRKLLLTLAVVLLGCALPGRGFAEDSDEANAVAPAPSTPVAAQIKGTDVDGHTIVLNKPGVVTLLLGTSEDSQDPARLAGEAMYEFQGRPDFQLMVIVDLRDSIANWVPSIVLDRTRANLDQEAVKLKPYFVKNGNKGNPRDSSHVVVDFNGAVFPLFGWTDTSDDLRGILFGVDGVEIKRWKKIQNMKELKADVHAAIEAAAKAGAGKVAVPAPAAITPTHPPRALPVTPAKESAAHSGPE